MKTMNMTKPSGKSEKQLTAEIKAHEARAKRAEALEDHVDAYLADLHPGAPTILVRDAIEHGWKGAHADIAETLRDLLVECRAEVERKMPFPILTRLDAIVTDLEDGIGA